MSRPHFPGLSNSPTAADSSFASCFASSMRICLNMIVRNEGLVIERCLNSVRPFIHSWAIADTGSTDNTQAIVRNALRDLPGQLIERPWVDFSTNRNRSEEHTSELQSPMYL